MKGWLLSEENVTRIALVQDSEVLAHAHLGLGRRDVYEKFPEYENAAAGFEIEATVQLADDLQGNVELQFYAGEDLILIRALDVNAGDEA